MRRKLRSSFLSFFRAALLLPGCMCLLAQTVLSQPSNRPSGDPAKKYKLEGTVINSLTGEPVPRALVQLNGPAQDSVLSGVDGRFHFNAVPEGSIIVNARKPGFFEKEESKARAWTRYAIAVGPQTGPITITLVPEGVIYGHVEDADGEPIENAQIRVTRVRIQEGRRKREQVSGAQTDEEGNYRIAELIPGTYYVGVQANSVRPQNPAFLSKQKPEGYPAVLYYPASPDPSSALPVILAAGQRVQLQFSLKKEPLFRVSGKVTGVPAGAFPSFQWLDLAGGSLAISMQFDRQGATFKGMVPAGAYGLRVTAPDADRHVLLAEQTITVGSDLADLHISLAPAVTLPVVVQDENTKETPSSDGGHPVGYYQPVNVRLSATGDSDRGAWASFDPADDSHALKVHDILPGKYSVEVMPVNGGKYVKSAKCGTVDLLREELVVAAGGRLPPIEAVLRDDGAILTGKVRNLNADSAASLLIVPQFAPMQHPRILNVSGQEEFQSSGMAPGDYKVFAFDSLDHLEYTDPEALGQYASQAATVTLSANGTASVTLELIRIGEVIK